MTSSRRNTSFPRLSDRVLLWLLRASAAIAGGIIVLILGFLVAESLPALREIGLPRFLTDDSWHPVSGRFDVRPMAAGTLLVTVGAALLAVPLGFGSAIFSQFCAPPRVAWIYRHLVELLAGIPSVVYGFWGLVVLVPLIAHSLLAGILIGSETSMQT